MAATSPSTSYQRTAIRCALRDLELPTDRVTVMHRDLFAEASVPWRDGAMLDDHLQTLTRAQASALLSALKDEDE